jgi:hypothetical protein
MQDGVITQDIIMQDGVITQDIIMQDGVITQDIISGCRPKVDEICAPLGYPRILDP